MSIIHKPVLLNEVIAHLNLKPGYNVIDCTFGGGGHGWEIWQRIQPNGKLLAIDADSEAVISNQQSVIRENIIFINDNFANLKEIVAKNFRETSPKGGKKFIYPVHGILLDLGMSSDQLEHSGRGFSFMRDEPLDMRFDLSQKLTAAQILNSYSLENLIDIFKNFGEYPHARRLAETIVKLRKKKKFQTVSDLVRVISIVHLRRFYERIHPATQVFQALRIAVNDELENLKRVLPQAVDILVKGGRLVVISFHGLEDGIVKNYFRSLVQPHRWLPRKLRGSRIEASSHYGSMLEHGANNEDEQALIKILTKKPISPSEEEIKNNSRSRSAKMRVIEKI